MGGTILKLHELGANVFVCIMVCGDLHFEHTNTVITRDERTAEFGAVMRRMGCEGTVLPFRTKLCTDFCPVFVTVKSCEMKNLFVEGSSSQYRISRSCSARWNCAIIRVGINNQ